MSAASVFWFTGLSGSGKSTVATGVKEALERLHCRVLILDGDDVRTRLHRHLGFSESEIKENNALVVGLCIDLRTEYDVVLVPIISPYRESRKDARTRIGRDFHEIYFNAGLDVVINRDTKGLYKKAQAGEIQNMIGFSPSAPYEAPEAPDLVIDTSSEIHSSSVDILLGYILKNVSHESTKSKSSGMKLTP